MEDNRTKSALALLIEDNNQRGDVVLLSGELSGTRLMELTNGIDNIRVIKSLAFILCDKNSYVTLEKKDDFKRIRRQYGIYRTLIVTLFLWPLVL